MKSIILFMYILAASNALSSELPEGVTMDTVPCFYVNSMFNYYLSRNNEVIGVIEPIPCRFSDTSGDNTNPQFYAEFYNSDKKDTLTTKEEALTWIITAIEDYYKPVVIADWQDLKILLPKVSLKYPSNWTYKLDRYDDIFESTITSENKLTLMIKDQRGQSEPVLLIRTPNTAKLTTSQVMEITASMNRAIDFHSKPAIDFMIGGKPFKSSENTFMQLMQQRHFWYADEKEIIYISCNLLKEERLRYPAVITDILQSISW